MRPLKIQMSATLPELSEVKNEEVECDDAVMITSKVNGAVLGAAKDGDPVLTREVSVWWSGFRTPADFYTRLSQGVLQLFMMPEDKETAQYNLINLIQFLIVNGGLTDKVSLVLSEKAIANSKEAKRS